MKRTLSIGLLVLGVVLAGTSVDAQIVPQTETTMSADQQPQPTSKKQAKRDKKEQKKRERNERRMQQSSDQNSLMNSKKSTSMNAPVGTNPDSMTKSMESGQNQDTSYRQGSVSSGTMMNNSNVNNYNSQQVTAAPTGVGSTSGATPTTPTTGDAATMKGDESPNLRQRAATATGAAVNGAVTTAPTVPPSPASPSTTVGDFTSSQPDYTTLQNALQAANLDQPLRGAGPFTVFAPSNSAFKKLPAQTQNTMLEGQNQGALKQLLQYHVVEGTVDAKELMRQINAGSGKAQLRTMSGGMLTAKAGTNGRIILTDEMGNTAYIDTPDQLQANGVVHGITGVLMQKTSSSSFK